MANRFTARNKLIYLVPFIAMFIDIVVGTATLKTMVAQVAGAVSLKILIPAFSLFLVVLDLVVGSYRSNNIANILGLVIISVVPILTLVEGYNELQNNIILYEAIDMDLGYTNIASIMKYIGLAMLSYATHYILFIESKVILSGYSLYDPEGLTKDNIDKIEEIIDESFDPENAREGLHLVEGSESDEDVEL